MVPLSRCVITIIQAREAAFPQPWPDNHGDLIFLTAKGVATSPEQAILLQAEVQIVVLTTPALVLV